MWCLKFVASRVWSWSLPLILNKLSYCLRILKWFYTWFFLWLSQFSDKYSNVFSTLRVLFEFGFHELCYSYALLFVKIVTLDFFVIDFNSFIYGHFFSALVEFCDSLSVFSIPIVFRVWNLSKISLKVFVINLLSCVYDL